MTAAARLTLSGTIASTPFGAQTIGPLIVSSADANDTVQNIVLQSGANTITLPTTPAPTGCIIQLNANNTAVVTLKGVTGDSGIAIGKTGFLMLQWDPAALPTSFVLTSASTQTGLNTSVIFF